MKHKEDYDEIQVQTPPHRASEPLLERRLLVLAVASAVRLLRIQAHLHLLVDTQPESEHPDGTPTAAKSFRMSIMEISRV